MIVFSRFRIVLFGDRIQKLSFSVVFVLFSLETVFKSYRFQSFSYCSLWRPFSKVIVFSRFRIVLFGDRFQK